jgi:hypothetical protein
VAKGGLLSGSGSGTFGITTIGTDSYILKADSSASNGISWLETLPVANGGTGTTSLTDKAVLVSQDSGTNTINSIEMTTDGQLLIGGTSGPQVATLTGSDNITITNGDGSIEIVYAAESDVRLKKDIISLESGLEKILNLNPVNFRWKKDDEKNNIGLIAQEVENIIPDAVKEYNNIKTISYNMITSTLIKGVQELKYENDYLKKENKLLNDQINNIFSRLDKAGL